MSSAARARSNGTSEPNANNRLTTTFFHRVQLLFPQRAEQAFTPRGHGININFKSMARIKRTLIEYGQEPNA
jgi:hypothetical protein